MAVSGAAFASATGSYQGAANVILALANARLGIWLPNPGQLKEIDEHEDQWWRPRPPWIRRLSYLLREIFGWYPKELAAGIRRRRRPIREPRPDRTVPPPLHRDLLLRCHRRHPDIRRFPRQVHHASGQRTRCDRDARRARKGRSEHGRRTGRRRRSEGTHRQGTHHHGQADLSGLRAGRAAHATASSSSAAPPWTKHTPWEIRRHAAAHPRFPNDATGDQWFDDCKFNAYTGSRQIRRKTRQGGDA